MEAEKVQLSQPVSWGKESITELVVKPTPRMFKGQSVRVGEDGSFDFEPYALAQIGAVAAGYTPAFVDKMAVADMTTLAMVVMGFFAPAPTAGSDDSPS